MPATFHVYILKCSDGSYYTGMTANLERRLAEHQHGHDPKAYTYRRRPIELVYSEAFADHDDAFRREHQVKAWSRAKKEALIRGDWEDLQRQAKPRTRK